MAYMSWKGSESFIGTVFAWARLVLLLEHSSPQVAFATRFFTFSRRSTKQVAHGYFQARPEGEGKLCTPRQLSRSSGISTLGSRQDTHGPLRRCFVNTYNAFVDLTAHRINWHKHVMKSLGIYPAPSSAGYYSGELPEDAPRKALLR
jgi:hypothetical protein